jgi:hypothetical protein
MPTWAYFVLGFIALIAAGTVGIRLRTRRIAASRAGEHFGTFCSAFRAEEVPVEVLRAVHGRFQEWCSDAVDEFPIRAADDIGDIYGMVNEDLDEALVEVVAGCGRQLPPTGELHQMHRVITVRDFALFVSACPKSAEFSELDRSAL